jgi:hypothetical protein
MMDMGIVQGSAAMAKPLVIGKDTVYVHTDIQEITDSDGNTLYQYHEVQYDKDEFIHMLAEYNDIVKGCIIELCGVVFADDGGEG